MFRVFVVVSALVAVAIAYPSGAPAGVCEVGTPKHGDAQPQAGYAPYTIKATPQGGAVSVSISGNSPFRGFLLTARDASGRVVPGSFVPSDGQSKPLACVGSQGSAATHTSNSDKGSVQLSWAPPSGFHGSVTFLGTVVQEVRTYWVGVQSNAVTV